MMPTFRSVLHPTDFSVGSARAFEHALRLTLAQKGRLRVVHVDPMGTEGSWAEFPGVRDTLVRWGELEEGADRGAVAALGVDIAKARRYGGELLDALIQEVEVEHPDLLVVSTHARAGLSRVFATNVAEPLARAAFVPTLFLPHGAPGFVDSATGKVDLKRILVPVAHEPRPRRALEAAAALARSLEASEVSIRVVYAGNAEDMPLVPHPRHEGLTWEAIALDGDPVAVISAQVAAWRPDVVVMATAGHQSLWDTLLGSTTEQVIHEAGVPVLAVPEAAGFRS